MMNQTYAIENHAVDGDTMYQLERDHLDSNLLSDATHIVISIGGNDLLYNISFLQTTSKLSKVMGKGAMIGKWGLKNLTPQEIKYLKKLILK